MRASVLLVMLLLMSGVAAGAVPALVPAPPTNGTLAQPLPLGTLTTTGVVAACPSGSACIAFKVTCPGVSGELGGFAAIAEPLAPARGVAMFFSGGRGTSFELAKADPAFATQLREDGFRLVQIRWSPPGWLSAPSGEQTGFAKLACRPATAIAWAHAAYYEPLGLDPARGACGFCITGNSGGSTQVGFALSHYGLDTLLDAVFPTGGPPHGALHKSCFVVPTESAYSYPDDTRIFIDEGWGSFEGLGPCFLHNAAWYARWFEDSVAGGGSDYRHDDTRVHLFVGENDVPMSYPAGDYLARLEGANSPMVGYTTVPSTQHFVLGSPAGRAAVRAAFLEEP